MHLLHFVDILGSLTTAQLLYFLDNAALHLPTIRMLGVIIKSFESQVP